MLTFKDILYLHGGRGQLRMTFPTLTSQSKKAQLPLAVVSVTLRLRIPKGKAEPPVKHLSIM